MATSARVIKAKQRIWWQCDRDLRIPPIQSVWAHMNVIYTFACTLTDTHTQASGSHVHVVTPAKCLMIWPKHSCCRLCAATELSHTSDAVSVLDMKHVFWCITHDMTVIGCMTFITNNITCRFCEAFYPLQFTKPLLLAVCIKAYWTTCRCTT